MEQVNMHSAEQAQFSVALASSSPQRQQILRELGIAFRFFDSHITEVTLADPIETVMTNAKMKVLGVRETCGQENVILGADTVLCVNGNVRGKPASSEEAVRYLTELSGGQAVAWTGTATYSPKTGRGVVLVERAEILFNVFAHEAVAWYVSTGEPLTRAGALGVSLLGEVFVESIRGAHSCVAGLPKRATLLALSDPIALGHHRMNLPQELCGMLRWLWIINMRRFGRDGQWE
jgi:septum formation protein